MSADHIATVRAEISNVARLPNGERKSKASARANAALDALSAEVAALTKERDEWKLRADSMAEYVRRSEKQTTAAEADRDRAEREAAEQMAAKLEAQMALAAITEALDLKLSDLGNGWTEGVKVILARIEMIVDEAHRLAAERDAALSPPADRQDSDG